MRCFYHRDRDAVGACKSCGRGVCPECAFELPNGLACRGRCEDEVRALNRIIARNKTAYEKTGGAYVKTAVFYAAVGALLVAAGAANWRGMAWMLLPAGLVCFVAAVLHYSTGQRFTREDDSADSRR
jgi:hypothetical protein